jgi:O-antigen ligase
VHKLTFWLLCGFVFSLPWEFVVTIELMGSVTRLLGAAAIASGVLTLVVAGRLRRPDLILFLALTFTLLNVLSLLWTIDFPASLERVNTYGQLAGLVWLIWEFARTQEEQQSLLIAYCVGAYVSVADLLRNFVWGSGATGLRYVALGFDPNDLGLMLGIGIPIAWYLFLNRRGIIRFLGAAYLPLAVPAILLTASRAAFLASIGALLIVPLTVSLRSIRSMVITAAVLLLASGTAALIVPEYNWNRVLTAGNELSGGGTMSGRVMIWAAGRRAFQDRPVLGAGAGAFMAAVEPMIGPRNAPHNVFLAILVEQGIVGFFAFFALLAVCGWRAYRLPPLERKVWAVIGFVWLVGAMSLGWQYRKLTWLLFGLLAAQAVTAAAREHNLERREKGRVAEFRSPRARHGAGRPTAA